MAALGALSGCGLFSEKDDEADRPMALVEFDATLPVQELWNVNTGKGLDRSAPNLKPFYIDGELWVADHEGGVRVIDAESGDVLRQFELELDLASGPAVFADSVLFGTIDGMVVHVDRASGQILWQTQLSSEVLALPVLRDGIVIARAIDGRVFGIDAESGRREWIYDRSVPLLTLRGNSDPLVRGGQVFIGYDDGAVTALRIADGVRLWEQRVSIPEGRSELERLSDIDGPLVIVGGDLYAVTRHGRMASLALDSGRIQWVKDIAADSGVSISRTQLAVTDAEDVVWMVDRLSGATVWQNESLKRRDVTRPVFQGSFVVVADREGYLHWLDADTGEPVARERAGKEPPAAAPLVIGNLLYLLDRDGRLSAWRVGAQR
nr:outer membrane protein assembly factor BamB [Wenzhouxiangella sp. XN79A]